MGPKEGWVAKGARPDTYGHQCSMAEQSLSSPVPGWRGTAAHGRAPEAPSMALWQAGGLFSELRHLFPESVIPQRRD